MPTLEKELWQSNDAWTLNMPAVLPTLEKELWQSKRPSAKSRTSVLPTLEKELRLPPRGSSPRVRGKGILQYRASRMLRIIPAGAGKRWVYSGVGRRRGDHPRGCGEKALSTNAL